MKQFLVQIVSLIAFIVVAIVFSLAYLFLLDIRMGVAIPGWLFGMGALCMFLISVYGACSGLFKLVQNYRSKPRAGRIDAFSVADPRFNQN